MVIKRFLIGLTGLLAVTTQAHATEVDPQVFARSASWRRALFFEGDGQTVHSLVSQPRFFADPKGGPSNPLRELEANLEFMRQPSTAEQGAAAVTCRFPYRLKLLKSQFDLPDQPPCLAFEAWRKRYQPTGVSLVYAAQYVANPSSAFGHAFLVMNSATQIEALWQTVNFAAAMPDDLNGFSYAWGGLTGWYAGQFSMMPFYQRLFYYGNVENRDLWLYPIVLSADQFDSALRLMWELVHNSKFTYYFLDENCAGAILRALAVILPELTPHPGGKPYIHPNDVIKALDRVGHLGPVRWIPSQSRRLREKYLRLTSSEQKEFSHMIARPERSTPLSDWRVAEVVMEWTDYQTRQNQGQLPTRLAPLERRAFVARAQSSAPPASDAIDFAAASARAQTRAPHLSHESMMAEVGGSVVDGITPTLDVTYRLAIHDRLDPEPGFLPYSTFEGFKLGLSLDSHQVWVRNFTLLKLENLQPLWSADPNFSWRVTLQAGENLLQPNPAALDSAAKVAAGAAFTLWGEQLGYALLGASLNGGGDLPQRHFQVGPELGLRLRTRNLRTYAAVSAGTSVWDGPATPFINFEAGASYSVSRRWELLGEGVLEALPTLSRQGTRNSVSVRTHF